MTDVEREAVVSGGDDARGVPLSSGREVGTKDANEDVGAASILDAKSSGVGIAGNENVSDCEDLPPENFPPGGLDYGDAMQDASSMEEVPSEDDDLLLSISFGPLTRSCPPRIFFLQTLKAQQYWCPLKMSHRQTLKLEAYWSHHRNYRRRQTLTVVVRTCK